MPIRYRSVDSDRFGVIYQQVSVVFLEIERASGSYERKGTKTNSSMALPKALPNMAAGNIAMQVGANGVCKLCHHSLCFVK